MRGCRRLGEATASGQPVRPSRFSSRFLIAKLVAQVCEEGPKFALIPCLGSGPRVVPGWAVSHHRRESRPLEERPPLVGHIGHAHGARRGIHGISLAEPVKGCSANVDTPHAGFRWLSVSSPWGHRNLASMCDESTGRVGTLGSLAGLGRDLLVGGGPPIARNDPGRFLVARGRPTRRVSLS